MKQITKWIFFVALMGMALACGRNRKPTPEPATPTTIEEPTPTPTPEPTPTPIYDQARVLKNGARLRVEPSTSAAVAGTLQANTRLRVISKEGQWYKVLDDLDQTAYIHGNLIQVLDPDGKPKTISEPVTFVQTKFPEPVIYRTLKGANMRLGPGTNYAPPVAQLPADAEITFDGNTGNWYHGTYNGKTGWVHSALLNIAESTPQSAEKPSEEVLEKIFEDEDERASEGVPSGTAESLPQTVEKLDSQSVEKPISPEQPQASDVIETAPPTELPSATPTVTPTSTPTPIPWKSKIIGVAPSTMRSQPSQLARDLEKIPVGSEVLVLDVLGDWVRIQTSQNTGFIPTSQIAPKGK